MSKLWMAYIKARVWLSGRRIPRWAVPIFAIGDSWFSLSGVNLPRPIDMLDWLRRFGVPVIDGAIPGYTIARERRERIYATAIKSMRSKAAIFLLSAGGNDLISSPEKMVKDPQAVVLSLAVEYASLIRSILGMAAENSVQARIYIHGYDYVHAEKEFWWYEGSLTSRFSPLGLTDTQINNLMREALDLWNVELSRIADAYPGVEYIDLRGTIAGDMMIEDIHASPAGYMRLAIRLLSGILAKGLA